MGRKLPIFYSALLLTGVNLLLRLVGTSFQVYISGRIGAAGVGLLQLVMSVGAMAMTAGMAGIRTGAMYLTAEELGKQRPGNVRWVLSGCFTYSIACSGLVCAGLYAFAPWIAENWIGNPDTAGAIRLLASFLPVNCLAGVMVGYFTAANRIATLAAVEVAEQLCSMATTMLMLNLWAGTDPSRACEAVVLGGGVSACLCLGTLTFLRLRERSPAGPRLPVRNRLLKTTLPLAISDDIKAGISTAENLMVPRRLGLYPGVADPLAAFGTVSGMVFPVLMFPAAILYGLAELLIPELARCAAAKSHGRIRYLVRRSLRVAMLYGCVFGALMFLVARELCMALYGSMEAGRYLKLYCILIPMLYCDAITDAMTKGLGQQAACVRYNILTSAMDVAFLFVLLPKYGMMGYFVSFLVTHLLNFWLSLRRLMKISRCRFRLRVPLLTAAAAVVAIALAYPFESIFIRCGVCLAALGSLLFLLRVLRREDILWVMGLIRKKECGPS